jgi:hypothetical protein
MSYLALARRLTQRRLPGLPTRRPPALSHSPRLEVLEHRDLPSTLVVTSTSDSGFFGDGSLRGEIAIAAIGDQIVFDPSLAGQTITLNSTTELYLDRDLTIQGPGAGQLTIRGNNDRVFEVARYANDTITGLTLTNGKPGGAAGAILNNGTLTLGSATLSGNAASIGGAIDNIGSLSLSGVTLSGNAATVGGGVYNTGTVTVDSSVLSGNTATFGNGGGIYNASSGTLTLSNSILANNSASKGGGIDNDGTLTLTSVTLVGNSTSSLAGGVYNAGTLTINSSNLTGNTAGFFGGGIYNDGELTMGAAPSPTTPPRITAAASTTTGT